MQTKHLGFLWNLLQRPWNYVLPLYAAWATCKISDKWSCKIDWINIIQDYSLLFHKCVLLESQNRPMDFVDAGLQLFSMYFNDVYHLCPDRDESKKFYSLSFTAFLIIMWPTQPKTLGFLAAANQKFTISDHWQFDWQKPEPLTTRSSSPGWRNYENWRKGSLSLLYIHSYGHHIVTYIFSQCLLPMKCCVMTL